MCVCIVFNVCSVVLHQCYSNVYFAIVVFIVSLCSMDQLLFGGVVLGSVLARLGAAGWVPVGQSSEGRQSPC